MDLRSLIPKDLYAVDIGFQFPVYIVYIYLSIDFTSHQLKIAFINILFFEVEKKMKPQHCDHKGPEKPQ